MSDTSKGLIKSYLRWFEESCSEEEIDDSLSELTLPYLDQHNDFLQLYVHRNTEDVTITDDGYVFRELSQCGCDLTRKSKNKRREMAEVILRSQGINPTAIDDKQILVRASEAEVPAKIHAAFMSMLGLSGLASVSPSNVETIFKEDVSTWMTSHKVPFEPEIVLEGKSKNEFNFDFMIPGRGVSPTKIVQTFDRPDSVHIESHIYRSIDVREVATEPLQFVAILSPNTRSNKKALRNLMAHNIDPWEWKNRDQLLTRLMARN